MSVILPAVLCMSSVNNVWAEQQVEQQVEQRVISIQIESNTAIINGESITLDSAPYLDSYNNTMVPIMFIASALNIPDENIEYNMESRKVTIKFNKEVLSFFMGDYDIYKTLADNTMTKHTMQNNAVAVLKDEVIFVPVRSVAEIFDIIVGWDDDTKMVTLTSGSSEVISISEVNQVQEVGVVEDLINLPEINQEVQAQDIHIQNIGVSFEHSNPFINESSPIGTYVVPMISVGESQSISQDDYMNDVALMLMNSVGQNLLTQESTQQSNIVTTGNERALAEQAINLINAERTKEGLEPLKIHEQAMGLAQSRAEDMAVRNYTTTLNPEGVSLNTIVSQKYGQRTSSNVANYVTSAQDALDVWRSFTPNNLLSYEYEYIGLGYSNSRWAYVLIGKMYSN